MPGLTLPIINPNQRNDGRGGGDTGNALGGSECQPYVARSAAGPPAVRRRRRADDAR